MTITLQRAIRVAGAAVSAGTTATYDPAFEADLVTRGDAVYVSRQGVTSTGDEVRAFTNPLTGVIEIFGPDGVIVPVAQAIGQSGVAASTPADTEEHVLATITVPGGMMGPNGRVEVLALWGYNSSAGTKTMRVKFGASTVMMLPTTTTKSSRTNTNIINRNSEVAQMVGAVSAATSYQDFLGSGSDNVAYSEDTTVDIDIQITGQKSVGGDTLALEYYSVVIYPHG